MADDAAPLQRADLHADPFAQFSAWREAAGTRDDVVALATASGDGRPSVRMVLLRGASHDALRFFTGYASRKARDLAANPWAALAWFDDATGRQVRAEGRVEPVPAEESDAYWATRPFGSRVSAWVSPQSAPVPDRATMDAARDEGERRFADGAVPRPDRWGGYRLQPDRFEFWERRADRFHDRFEYAWNGADAAWGITRLWP